MTALAMTEAQLQAAIVAAARVYGYLTYHTHDSRRSAAGFPDLCLAGRGRVIFAELKREKANPSQAQEAWLTVLAAGGAQVYVWRPSDWTSGRVDRVLAA